MFWELYLDVQRRRQRTCRRLPCANQTRSFNECALHSDVSAPHLWGSEATKEAHAPCDRANRLRSQGPGHGKVHAAQNHIDSERIDNREIISKWRTSFLSLCSVGDSEHSVGETVPTKRLQITPRNNSAPHSCWIEAPKRAMKQFLFVCEGLVRVKCMQLRFTSEAKSYLS
jgi:hypothetical protein